MMMPVRRLAAGSTLLLAASVALAVVPLGRTTGAAAETPAQAGRVMVVGDSISQGSSGDFTWRYRLWNHFVDSGISADLVGPRNDLFDNVANRQGDHSYGDEDFDQDHDSVWGRALLHAKDTISAEVGQYTPDYVLVLLGINDLSFGLSDPAGTEANLRAFIANARGSKANVKLVLGKLLPTQRTVDDATFAAAVANYNQRIVQVASSLGTTQSPIAVAETPTGFSAATDTYDGVHPNARGEVKIAAAFADALADGFGVGPRYPRPLPTVPLGPQTPPQLTVQSGNGEAQLSWTPSPGATGYWVWSRRPATEQNFTRSSFQLPPGGSPWTAGPLIPGQSYEFKLQAVKGNAEGVLSNVVQVTVTGVIPSGATGLTAAPGSGHATLRWTAAGNATAYYVWQRNVTAGEEFSRLPWPVGGTSWTAGLLVNGATYEFKLQSVNGSIEGGYSNVAQVTPTGPAPAGATGLTGTPGDGAVLLSWTAAADATGYYVWMRNVTAGEEFGRLPYAVSGTQWNASLLVNGSTYEFKLQSVNGLIEGGSSNVVRVTPTVAPPSGPTNLVATPGNGQVTLSWTAAENVTGYYVWVRNVTADEAFSRLPWAVGGTSWTAGLLANGVTYEFKLQSVNGLVEGAYSATVRAQPSVAPPAGPAQLTATAGSHKAVLSWSSATNATGYYVWVRNVTAGEAFSRLPWAVGGTSWTAGLLSNGARYEFKLQSVSGIIEGGFSPVVAVTPTGPAPGGPTGFTGRPANRKAVLTWTLPNHATSVYIYIRNVTAGEAFTRMPYPVYDDTFTVDYLANGATYEFKLQAYNDLIAGGFSSVVQVRPTAPPPPGPTNLTAQPGNQKAVLAWDQADQATGYYVWVRARGLGGEWSRLPYPVGGDNWVAGLLVNGAVYDFKLQAVDGLTPGGYSNTVSVTPLGPTPQAPDDLTVRGRLGEAELSWTGTSSASGYHVQQRDVTAGESFGELPFPLTQSPFTGGLLIPGHRYEFRLQAINGLQRGTLSNTVSVLLPLPSAPTGMSATPGVYAANLRWNGTSGVDGYIIYYGWTAGPSTTPPLNPLPYPVSATQFTAGMLTRPGVHHFAVAAVKYGVTGPRSAIASISPYMENPYYLQAHWKYLDNTYVDMDTRTTMSGPSAPVDSIVIARAFIASDPSYDPIGDRRGFDPTPTAGGKITVAWDTRSGRIGAYTQRSCIFIVCANALQTLPIESTAGDLTPLNHNYVWWRGSAASLSIHWKASNSLTSDLWPATGHIDARVTITGNGADATAVADHFPSYEAYRYPRYTVNGVRTVIPLFTCGQTQILGLYDAPGDRRTCA